jgi:hypothetical protein
VFRLFLPVLVALGELIRWGEPFDVEDDDDVHLGDARA